MVNSAKSERKRPPKEVIGLTGVTASGKTTVAKILQGFGFQYITMRDALMRDLTAKNMPITRENLRYYEEKLIERRGKSILAINTRTHIINEGGSSWIVEGIINPQQVAEFRKLPKFTLVGINAPLAVIQLRMQNMRRRRDALKLDKIREKMDQELADEESGHYWHVGRCLELADYILDNSTQFDDGVKIETTELYAGVERMLRGLGSAASLWRSLQEK